MPKLGVNIDHVATLRQARMGRLPNPLQAARICEEAGADSIVAHLREDRRHIQDSDVRALRKGIKTLFNLEMSISEEIVRIACRVKPYQATLVPEKRKELTTEGGLNVADNLKNISSVVRRLENSGICVSLFIDPVKKQIDYARKAGARIIELHTGGYAGASAPAKKKRMLGELRRAVCYARALGITVNAGHGLDYANAGEVACIEGINELNIGYSIICESLYSGLHNAVSHMKRLIK